MNMRKLRNIFGVLTLLVVVSCGQNETVGNSINDTSSVAVTGSSSEDENAVAAAVDSLVKGILNADRNLLEDIASEALSYGHSAGRIENKAEFVDYLLNAPFDFLSVNTTNQTITVSGDNAIVRHTFTAKATNSGKPVDINLGVLLVWRKESGQWKLFARQGYKVPEPAK